MLKAVLANDKKKTNQMLRELINWNALGIEIVGAAEDGDSAMEMIFGTAPDIVVISARLKGLYGPDLIRTVREHGIGTSFLVVQGTRSFDSCYAALKSGVEDYLVGQINTTELAASLKKICDRKLQEAIREENERKEQRMFETNRGLIRKHFMSNYINGTIHADFGDPVQNINRLNGQFLFNFRPGSYEVLLIKPDFKPGSDINRTEIHRFLEELGAIVEEQLGKRCSDLVWFAQRGELFCVLNYGGDLDKELQILFERLRKRVWDRMDGSCTMARGSRERDAAGVVNSALVARGALESRVVLGVDRVLDAEQLRDLNRDTTEFITPEREVRLRSSVEALNSKSFGGEIGELFGEMAAREDLSATQYYAVARRVGELVLEQLRDSGIQPGNPNALLDEYEHGVSDSYSVPMLRTMVIRWGVGILERMLYEKEGRESRSMRLAKGYIREHFREAIKLGDVAGYVHLNPSYFSTLFKKELGINFNDFLIECRLNEARELLRTTTLSVSKIAEGIGYSDAKYFSKLFVKVVGMKPTEYRRLYS